MQLASTESQIQYSALSSFVKSVSNQYQRKDLNGNRSKHVDIATSLNI